MKRFSLKKLVERVSGDLENHVEYIRYLWPDKEVSSRFKLLNFLSADWLRCDVGIVRSDIHRVRLYLDAMSELPEDISPEDFCHTVKAALKCVERAEKSAENLYRI